MRGYSCTVFVLVLWSVVTPVNGRLFISECLPPLNRIVLPADLKTFSVTCDGLFDTHTAVWNITDGATTTAQLTCPTGSGGQQCSSSSTDLTMVRNSPTSFTVTVIQNSNTWFGKEGVTISCSSGQDPTAQGTCGIRLASPPPTQANVVLNITECPKGGVTLREDRFPAIFTCQGFADSDSVTWKVRVKGSDSEFNSITCGPSSMFCVIDSEPYVFALRERGKSQLYILNEYRLRRGRDSIQCTVGTRGQASCDIEAINPAVVSDCQVRPTNSDWDVAGSCHFSGAYSTPAIYTCNWIQQFPGQADTTVFGEINDKVKFEANNGEYYNGTCSFRSPLPTQEGRYTYVMNFFPGPDVKPSADVTIQRPGAPVTSCPNHRDTNINVRCDCLPNPDTPGSPLPTTQWSDRGPGVTLVIASTTAVTSDQMPKCQLTWGPAGNQVEMETPLAFGPEVVSIIKPQRNQSVEQDLSVTCDVSNAFPNATITWTSSIAGFSCSPLDAANVCTIRVAQYHDRETVTCTARNGLFPDTLFGSDTFTIYVQ